MRRRRSCINGGLSAFPLAYSSILEGAKPGDAYLRNSDGQLWAVRITKDGDTWYFTDGWKEHLEEINVQNGVIFTFDYGGSSIFDFQLLGRNGCCKSTTWSPFPVIMEAQRDEEKNDEVGKVSEEERRGDQDERLGIVIYSEQDKNENRINSREQRTTDVAFAGVVRLY